MKVADIIKLAKARHTEGLVPSVRQGWLDLAILVIEVIVIAATIGASFYIRDDRFTALVLAAVMLVGIRLAISFSWLWLLKSYSRPMFRAVPRWAEGVPILDQKPLPLKAPIATLFNGSLSEGWWTDYRTLVGKQREQSITAEEHRELVLRNDMLEELQLGRAKMMTALAGTLGISEEQLVEQYDIRPREVG